jgi:hypothetical protein
MPSRERFQHAPCGARLKRCLLLEVLSFAVDSSRSYAIWLWLKFRLAKQFLRTCAKFTPARRKKARAEMPVSLRRDAGKTPLRWRPGW